MSHRQGYVSLKTTKEVQEDDSFQVPQDSQTLRVSDIELEDIQQHSEEIKLNVVGTGTRTNRCKSLLKKLEGKLLIFSGGTIGVIGTSLVKHVSQIPVGQFAFFLFGFGGLIILPVLLFQERSVDTKGKLKYVLLRAIFGGLAGVMKFWSARVMEFGDACAIFALSPIFASIFSRVLWKEKINIFTIISLILGLGGIVLIAKPSFIFGGDGADLKTYSQFFPLVPFTATILLGFAFSCMRKVGTEINMLVVPLYICMAVMPMSVVFNFAEGDGVVAPGCYFDRIALFSAGFAFFVALALLNKGLAIEKSGPGTLVRNFDIVTGYVLQMLFFNNVPELLSIIGATFILASVVLSTINKLFLGKYIKHEI